MLLKMSSVFGKKREYPGGISYPNTKKLSKITHFTNGEIKRLFERFCIICDANGLLSKIKYLQQPEVLTCQIMPMAFDYQLKMYNISKTKESANDTNNATGLSFDHFVILLSQFSQKALISEKAMCKRFLLLLMFLTHILVLFKMLSNNAAVLSKDAYREFLSSLFYGYIPQESMIDEVVDEIWTCASEIVENNDMTPKLFVKLFSGSDMHLIMTLPF